MLPVNAVQIEQVQRVCARTVAGDRQLVQAGSVLLAGQLYRVGDVGFFCPAVGSKPRVGLFILEAVFKGLMEQAEMVPQSYTVSRQAECCQRIQKAGSQTTKTAVAKGWLRLDFFDVRQALACSREGCAGFIVEPQIDQVVGQQLADQKLGADIIQLASCDRLHLAGALVPDNLQQGQIQLLIRAVSQWFAGIALQHFGKVHKQVLLYLLSTSGKSPRVHIFYCDDQSFPLYIQYTTQNEKKLVHSLQNMVLF